MKRTPTCLSTSLEWGSCCALARRSVTCSMLDVHRLFERSELPAVYERCLQLMMCTVLLQQQQLARAAMRLFVGAEGAARRARE